MGHHGSKLEPITENDIEIIKSGWSSINSREEFGLDIMVRLFLNNRDIKSKWIFASNLETEEEMRSNSQLKYHAKKVVDLLNKVVERVVKSDPEHIDLDDFQLIKLGSNHFHYGVIRDDFVHFEESYICSLKKHLTIAYSPRVEKSFKKIFYLVTGSLCDGIEKEAVNHQNEQQ